MESVVATMWGYHGNSKCSNTYRYYRCTKRNEKGCKNRTIPKEIIEDKVIRKLKSLLTEKNIEKISKKIYDTCQKENNSNVVIKNLEKKEKQLHKKIDNLMEALENGQHIDMISQRITQNEKELEETQSQFLLEMAKIFKLSEKEIKFFLTRLQDGDILDNSYRKVLVDMLVNSILVYDNELVVICNVGNKPISLTIDLIEDIESNLVTEPFTFVKRFGSPSKNRHFNTYGGFYLYYLILSIKILQIYSVLFPLFISLLTFSLIYFHSSSVIYFIDSVDSKLFSFAYLFHSSNSGNLPFFIVIFINSL